MSNHASSAPSNRPIPAHYKTLGVDPSISQEDLVRHYRKVSLQYHPDRAAYRADLTEEEHRNMDQQYRMINEAYKQLSNPETRAAYDAKHGVNFNSRIHILTTLIDRHNVSVANRTSHTHSDGVEKRTREESHPSEEDDDDGDDDEEYDPLANPPSSSPKEADDLVMAKCFSLQPTGVINTATQLRSVQLLKKVSPEETNCNDSWGLALMGNIITDCNQDKYDNIVFPSRIVQIASFPVKEGDSVVSKLEAAERQQKAQGRSANHDTVKLNSLIEYNVRDLLLTGNIALLQEEKVVNRLVLKGKCAVLSLLPNATVLAVNEIPISNGNELREALLHVATSRVVFTVSFLPEKVKEKQKEGGLRIFQ